MIARELMTTDLVTVRTDTPVKAALALLDENDITSLPVVGPGGRIAGVVSEADLIRELVGPDPRTREIPHDDDTWSEIVDDQPTPDQDAETSEQVRAVRAGIDSELTPRQRQILIALTVRDVPIDVLAERMNTTRGALYKALHDARRKLRAYLSAHEIGGGRFEEVTA